MEAKNVLKSKTLWFNVLGAAAMLFGDGGALGHVLAPDEVGLGLAVGNLVLRFFTDRKVIL